MKNITLAFKSPLKHACIRYMVDHPEYAYALETTPFGFNVYRSETDTALYEYQSESENEVDICYPHE